MSVQLIVFPQSYEGQYNSITSSANDFIVDGINFNTMNTSSSYDSGAGTQEAIDNQPPTVVNTWYRYRTTVAGTPTLPTELSGNLTLLSVPTATFCGVYQKLSNLVVGTAYEIVIDLSTTGTGFLLFNVFDGSSLVSNNNANPSSSQVVLSFTATTTTPTIVITYFNTTTDFIAISNISVSEQGITPTTIYTDLQDGQVICDLYEDEDIPLSLSVDDFKNVAEKVQSYSKAFNLPATKRNNQIFDNIFEVTRTDNGLNFNPYKRTKAILKQDGFLLFEGYLRMLDISDKSGETSYNVNLYSEVVALADVLGDKTFSDLDFTELTHDYNRTNIIRSWRDAGGGTSITYTNPDTSGFRDDYTTLRYPFVNWTHQILVGGSSGTNATVGNPEFTALEQIFRPFINIKYLIDRIFEVVPFTYESEFFDTDDFKKLYMDFNWGADNAPTNIWGNYFTSYYFAFAGSTPSYNYATTTYSVMELTVNNIGPPVGYVPPNYDTSTFILTSTVVNEHYYAYYEFKIKNTDTVDRTVECQWLYNSTPINYSGILTIPANGGVVSYTGSFNQTMINIGDTLQVQFRTNAGTANKVRQRGSNAPDWGGSVFWNEGVSNVTSGVILQTLRGELGQWDFLKGLMTMFNLVTLPDEDNPSNIKIEPYGDIFINNPDSVELDWTDKIDVSEMKLMPLTDLNKKTIFKFVEDEDDYAFNVYKNANNHLYGSKKYDASGFTILAGEDEIVAEPFAATVVKPLMSQYSDFITPSVYSMSEDEVTEGFENSPRIMYNNGIKSTGASYYIPEQNGVASSNETDFLQFSHLTDVPTISGTRDFHFGECQLLGAGAPTNNNLFNLYWLPYYAELYNPDTRIMTIKVNLSPSDINTFKFNDTIFIKNRTFRVNKIDYKPNDLATVEFILIP